MSNSNNTSSFGIGFVGLLTALFIGLKLTGFIAWSWLWVLAPLWMGTLAFIGVVGVAVVVILAVSMEAGLFASSFVLLMRLGYFSKPKRQSGRPKSGISYCTS